MEESLGFFRKNFCIDSRSLLMGIHFWSGNGSTFKWAGREGNREMRRVVGYPGNIEHTTSRILAHVSNAVRKTLSRNIRGFFASFPPIFVFFGNLPSHVPRGGTEGGNGKYLEILFSLGVDGGLLSLNTFLGGDGGC